VPFPFHERNGCSTQIRTTVGKTHQLAAFHQFDAGQGLRAFNVHVGAVELARHLPAGDQLLAEARGLSRSAAFHRPRDDSGAGLTGNLEIEIPTISRLCHPVPLDAGRCLSAQKVSGCDAGNRASHDKSVHDPPSA
jgi:hypothetical protein